MRAMIMLLMLTLFGGAACRYDSSAESADLGTLEISVVDVEGGEATLFVSPSGESLLVDTGWPGLGGRDAGRIWEAAQAAGVSQIDHLVITHFHADHFGGTEQLAARLPIRRYYDHGSTIDQGERAQAQFRSYADLRSLGVHTVVAPGDRIPMTDLDVTVLASGGATLGAALSGAGDLNPYCQTFRPHGPEITGRAADAEDQRSVSLFIRYGAFRTVIMGDLTWNKEAELMCPANPIGTVDAYLVSHHGSDTSGSEVLVHAMRPRVAIMNNGPRKGGSTRVFEILARSPGLEDLWQSHYSMLATASHNMSQEFVANLEEGEPLDGTAPDGTLVHMGHANGIVLSARTDGSFTVTNTRSGYSKHYGPRR